MRKKRVFIAIPLPKNIQEKVLAWQSGPSNVPARWIKPENLHITVIPPWYVSDDELYTIIKVTEGVLADFKSFPVVFSKVFFGPPGAAPRLIWAEGKAPPEFIKIKKTLEEELFKNPETGFLKKETRPAKFHLTMARFRPGSLKNLPHLNGGINWKFTADKFNIMESELKRSGAEYASLQSVPLST